MAIWWARVFWALRTRANSPEQANMLILKALSALQKQRVTIGDMALALHDASNTFMSNGVVDDVLRSTRGLVVMGAAGKELSMSQG